MISLFISKVTPMLLITITSAALVTRCRSAAIAVLLVGACLVPSASRAQETLQIFLMAGQSNNVGHARTFYEGPPNTGTFPYQLEYLADTPAFVAGLNAKYSFKDAFEDNWMLPRDDAWGIHIASSSGSTEVIKPTPRSGADQWIQGVAPLGPGFGNDVNTLSKIGPELAFGHYLADRTEDPIFLFKSDTGGTTLGVDWRPPSAVANRPANGSTVGSHYSNTINRFTSFLDELDADLADDGMLNTYNNATGYEVSGMVWFQGFNEQFNDGSRTAAQLQAEYAANLVDLVHDIRAADSRIPSDLGAIIPESSDLNTNLNNARQAAVATLNSEIPSSAAFFRNNDLIDSRPNGYHFHETAESYLEIGHRMGRLGIATIDSNFAGPSANPPSTLTPGPSPPPGSPNASVDFEQSDYNLGPWTSQKGGGIVWWEWNADSTGEIVAGGYNSPQAAKLGVDELAQPQSGVMQSDGADMLAFFPQAENFILSGMAYAHLNPDPAGNGTARDAWFSMSGISLNWSDNGNIIVQAGGRTTNTGVPIAYDQWASFSIQIDHTTHDAIVHYNGQEILSTNIGGNSTFSDSFNVWLDTIDLSNNPDPNDYLLLDNITIQTIPEPSTLLLTLGVVGGLMAWRRRRAGV